MEGRNGTGSRIEQIRKSSKTGSRVSDLIIAVSVGSVVPILVALTPWFNGFLTNMKEREVISQQREVLVYKPLYDKIELLSLAFSSCQEINKALVADSKYKTEKLLDCKK